MEPLEIETKDNSKEEILINEKEKNLIEDDKKGKINNIEDLKKYIPSLKECDILKTWPEQFGNFNEKEDVDEDDKMNKDEKKESLLELLGFLSGMSILGAPIVISFLFAGIPLIVIFIIYIILVILQFFNPTLKEVFHKTTKEDFEEFKKKITKLTKTNVIFKNGRKKSEKEDMEFILRNCIDISGEVDMTKPPKFSIYKTKRREIRYIPNHQTNLNNKVSIIFRPPIKVYTIDKSSERKIDVYIKNYAFINKKPVVRYSKTFFREVNKLYYLSIPLLASSLVIGCFKEDTYYIETKKIISCDQDLDTNYYLSLCSNLKPKFTFLTGEKIEFDDNCISKADEGQLKIFNEKYSRILGKRDAIVEKLIQLGYVPNKTIYEETLGNLYIYVYVNNDYKIEFKLRYELKNVEYSYTLGRNIFSFQSEVNLDCTKEGLEKEGDKNYLYIKYLEEPIIFGNYNDLQFMVEFDGAKTVFGPEVIYC